MWLAFALAAGIAAVAVESGPELAAPSLATVPAPERPPDCHPSMLSVWTSRVAAGATHVVLRLRNDGEVLCEADLRGTPDLHPLVEPDVWIEPGGSAELVLGPSGQNCLRPEVVSEAGMLVGSVPVRVPTLMVAACGWAYRALYPVEPPDQPCVGLVTIRVSGAVLVLNQTDAACSIGPVRSVDGSATTAVASVDGLGTRVRTLQPGDVAGFVVRGDHPCQADERPVTLVLEGGTTIVASLPGCPVEVELSAAVPWLDAVSERSPVAAATAAASVEPW